MTKLPPLIQEMRVDTGHLTGAIDIIMKHLTAMREELQAHGEQPAPPDQEQVPEL